MADGELKDTCTRLSMSVRSCLGAVAVAGDGVHVCVVCLIQHRSAVLADVGGEGFELWLRALRGA